MAINVNAANVSFGEAVRIDRSDVWGVITAMLVRPACCGEDPVPFGARYYVTFEVSYVLNGEAKSAWIESWRLSK